MQKSVKGEKREKSMLPFFKKLIILVNESIFFIKVKKGKLNSSEPNERQFGFTITVSKKSYFYRKVKFYSIRNLKARE